MKLLYLNPYETKLKRRTEKKTEQNFHTTQNKSDGNMNKIRSEYEALQYLKTIIN